MSLLNLLGNKGKIKKWYKNWYGHVVCIRTVMKMYVKDLVKPNI